MRVQHRLAQFRRMCAKPLASFAIPRACRRDQTPVGRRMIEPLEVHQLMDHHVVPHPRWHRDEAPVEADVAVAPAGSPSRPLVANADTRHRQAVRVSQFQQSPRQLGVRLHLKPLSIVNGQAPARQNGALPHDPFHVTLREGIGLSTRSAARNRDAEATVGFDAEQVSPGPAMPHEIDRRDRADEGRCESVDGSRYGCSRLAERKPQLHDDRIPDSETA
jgi:hypothetical protein